MIKKDTINDRISYIIENQCKGNQKKFAEIIGFAPQVVYNIVSGRKSKPSYDVLKAILSSFVDVSSDWLLTGKEPMLKDDIMKATQVTDTVKGIPLVNVTAIGGFGNAKFAIEDRDVKDYYVIPKFKHKKVDFMIEVEGSSMYPKYNSGDVVACRIIDEQSFIQWNKTHVIATKGQGIIIKRIKKGVNGSLLMVSDNKDYDPFPVPTEEIDGIALVVGVIRLE